MTAPNIPDEPTVREYGPNGERLYEDPAYNAIRVEDIQS